jgi:hypothetical protein
MGKRCIGIGLVCLAMAGCTSVQPLLVAPTPPVVESEVVVTDNPVFIELGHRQYGYVFEACLKVLLDYGFEIAESNRYDGRIETLPRIAPGLLQIVKPGSPSFYERLLATTQTYRHRVSLIIQPGTNQGYFIEVIARKELEDLPKPVRGTVGGAVFRSENTVERQYEVIDPIFFEQAWIFKGRDVAMEQEIIRRLENCLSAGRDGPAIIAP